MYIFVGSTKEPQSCCSKRHPLNSKDPQLSPIDKRYRVVVPPTDLGRQQLQMPLFAATNNILYTKPVYSKVLSITAHKQRLARYVERRADERCDLVYAKAGRACWIKQTRLTHDHTQRTPILTHFCILCTATYDYNMTAQGNVMLTHNCVMHTTHTNPTCRNPRTKLRRWQVS